MLFAILGALNCILTLLAFKKYFFSAKQSVPAKYSYFGDDFPTTAPVPGGSLPAISYTFEESMRFQSDNTSLNAWYGNLARQFGYLRLGSEYRIFAVSMHHQQHCLYFFAQSFAEKRHHNEHTKHCLNYLRQNILCQADMTLEPPHWIERAIEGQVVAVTRSCRDWRMMYQFVEDNYWDWVSYRKEHLETG